jgi:hypothetical protein
MGQSGPFVSTCSRRQLARRRSLRWRRGLFGAVIPALFTATFVLAGTAAFFAGRGSL